MFVRFPLPFPLVKKKKTFSAQLSKLFCVVIPLVLFFILFPNKDVPLYLFMSPDFLQLVSLQIRRASFHPTPGAQVWNTFSMRNYFACSGADCNVFI
jgi:hypothetical protein